MSSLKFPTLYALEFFQMFWLNLKFENIKQIEVYLEGRSLLFVFEKLINWKVLISCAAIDDQTNYSASDFLSFDSIISIKIRVTILKIQISK